MLSLRNRLSPPHLRSQIFTVSAGLRVSATAAGAALAGAATEAGGGVILGAVGALWIVSAALLISYPQPTEDRDYTPLPSAR